MQTTYQTPLELGTPVFGSEGEKIGEIAEIQSDYFVIEKGFIFTTDLYVPMTAVSSRDEDGVRLSLTKDDIDHGDWSSPPVLSDQEAAGPVGYAGKHEDSDAIQGGSGAGTYATDGVNGENGYDSTIVREDRIRVDDETNRP